MICCLLVLRGFASGQVTEQARVQRILLVHSFGRDYAPFTQVVAGFREELSRISPRPVEFYETSLELARFDGVEREEPLVTYLESVFGGRRPDLVVPFGAPAILFCDRNRDRLFPNAPVLAAGADKRRIAGLENKDWLTSVSVDLDLPALAEGIRRLVPDLRHLHVVLGVSPLERFWETQLREEWPLVLDGVEIHWLSDRPLAVIERDLARLPDGSAVFHGIMARDSAGVSHEYENALTAVRKASRAPVFGYSFEQLGSGIIGGPLVRMRDCGVVAAGVATRLLDGEQPGRIASPPIVPGPPVFDWRELEFWNIPHSRLPVGSIILHQPPGIWQTHRGLVLAAGAVVILQSATILMLFAARRRARESAQGLRMAIEAANVGLWSRETDGHHDDLRASPEWRALFDLPENGPLHADQILARIHPEDLPDVRESMKKALEEGVDYDIEHRVIRSGGEVRWVSTRGRCDPLAGSRRQRIRGATTDITARKHAEAELAARRDQLAHLNRAASLGTLSGALAHEINQPLGSILTNAQTALMLLDRERPDRTELVEILRDIVAEDQRAAQVIRRLRSLLERGECAPHPVDPAGCLDSVLSLLALDLQARGIHVRNRLQNNAAPVLADPVQLQQVFLNLLGNACDATSSIHPPGERHITVGSVQSGALITLFVEDNGPGFPADPAACFEPFQSGKPHGLGMGLAICQSILHAHGGSITAATGESGGGIVRFTLPAAAPS